MMPSITTRFLYRFLMNPSTQVQDWQSSICQGSVFHMSRPSKKLSDKFLGLYEILAHLALGTHSVTLRLPNSLQAVHLVFHISMLEPAFPNPMPDCVQPPPPPILVNNKPKFEI